MIPGIDVYLNLIIVPGNLKFPSKEKYLRRFNFVFYILSFDRGRTVCPDSAQFIFFLFPVYQNRKMKSE